jgi:hypothetical protein
LSINGRLSTVTRMGLLGKACKKCAADQKQKNNGRLSAATRMGLLGKACKKCAADQKQENNENSPMVPTLVQLIKSRRMSRRYLRHQNGHH